MMPLEWLMVTAASGLAGFVDAVVGGGGLVLVPALFAAFPQAHPASLFGVNKGSSMWGTGAAAWRYARHVRLPWRRVLWAMLASFAASMIGAWAVTWVSPAALRLALPWVLVAVLVYTLLKKQLGVVHQPRCGPRAELAWMVGIAAVIGAYDGFFGPGTGSFFVILLVRILGYDFLHASAVAKCLNLASNVSAFAWFAVHGYVWWGFLLFTALANVAGSLLGSRLAIRHGAGFVRVVFVLVVSALIVKTMHDAYF